MLRHLCTCIVTLCLLFAGCGRDPVTSGVDLPPDGILGFEPTEPPLTVDTSGLSDALSGIDTTSLANATPPSNEELAAAQNAIAVLQQDLRSSQDAQDAKFLQLLRALLQHARNDADKAKARQALAMVAINAFIAKMCELAYAKAKKKRKKKIAACVDETKDDIGKQLEALINATANDPTDTVALTLLNYASAPLGAPMTISTPEPTPTSPSPSPQW